jgi:iron complex outermembrane receptor protein
MKLTTILIFLFIAVKIPLLAQVKVISGNVTDINNQPISNVLVMGNGTDSVYTDSKGKYKITIKDTVSILLYTKVGYYIHSEEIQNRDVVNVKIDGLELVELSLKELLQVNVSTVSLSTQRIIDAPGIVSVITREDLKYLGIRTIREALTLVAGFSPLQNDDEQILAVRGIFATTNQKILVMRDGHSLNEANIDLPQTDYSLSIENIKKIEIIRGPGASIYGNSALAAVVNIITMEEETTSVKVGAGNYGQFNVDFVSTNKTSGNGFFSTFGRFAGTNGQSFDVPVEITQHYSYPGTYKTNHYPTNFDLGFKYKFKSVYSSFSARSHNYRTYWTAQGYYTNVDSLLAKPGLKQESYHFDFRWEPKISDNIRLNLQHYADYSKLTNYRLLGRIDSIKYTKGYTQLNEWNVFKSGLNYYTIWQYSA